jgi:epidermal growth factor receptor substrate 15
MSSSASSAAVAEQRAKEKAYYDALWKRADSNNDGSLNGSEAVHFLRSSGLSVDQLEEIWNTIDVNKKGFLNITEFYYCMRLIGLVQSGAAPSAAALKSSTTVFPIPKFDSVAVMCPTSTVTSIAKQPTTIIAAAAVHRPTLVQSERRAPPTTATATTLPNSLSRSISSAPSTTHTTTTTPPPATADVVPLSPSPSLAQRGTSSAPPFPTHVTRAQFQQYQQFFASIDTAKSGSLSGQQARDFFMRSNLPSHVLGRVWEMADVDHDGKLNMGEFALAMHLINAIIAGCRVPTPLPISLHPATITKS